MMLSKFDTNDPLGMFQEKLNSAVEGMSTRSYEPTGVQEEIITVFGKGEHQIILCLHNNKGGKTATAVNIFKNVFWQDYQDEFFPHRVYRKWPFESKQGRIIGTVKNTADDGPIRKEIMKWWPRSRFQADKLGKKYFSHYLTDTEWEFDVMTYEQEPDEFEGPLLSWTWCDEPPPEKLVGAITSRFMGGGIWLITATPIRCGPFLAVMKDMRDHGTRIAELNASLFEFSKTSGRPNHKGRMKGIWTDEQIKDYVATIPPDEVDARIHGKGNAKSGVVYPKFSRDVHVVGAKDCPIRDWSYNSQYVRSCVCFNVMDPHPKGYPALQWWALTPDNDYVCYNEWPTRGMLNMFYDEVRGSLVCPYTVEEMSKFIRILDGAAFGLQISRRAMDPRFGKGTEGTFGRGTESLMTEYAKYLSPSYELPKVEKIAVQREVIRSLLHYDALTPISWHNRPHIYFLPHCENSIRAIERHYWDEDRNNTGAEKEAERYKDFVDCTRYFLAMVGDGNYEEALPRPKEKRLLEPTFDEALLDTALA